MASLKRFFWLPYLLAYAIPAYAVGYTLAALKGWFTPSSSMLQTWVELILAQILVVVIGAFVLNEKEPERLGASIAHAVLSSLACPLAILAVAASQGYLSPA